MTSRIKQYIFSAESGNQVSRIQSGEKTGIAWGIPGR